MGNFPHREMDVWQRSMEVVAMIVKITDSDEVRATVRTGWNEKGDRAELTRTRKAVLT